MQVEENKPGLSVEDLLKPRYEVISKWPDSGCEIEDIINLPSKDWIYGDEEKTYCGEDYFDIFPSCFKKLAWYEKRDIKDLPGYVKEIKTGIVYKIGDEFKYYSTYIMRLGENYKSIGYCYLQPSTEIEYLDYQSKQKVKQ